MTLTRISTAFSFRSAGADLMRAQARQVEAQSNVSNGKRASDLRGFGRSSETLIAARTVQARAKSFVDQHTLLASELSAQNQALTRVSELANQAKQLVIGAISSNRADTLMDGLNSLFSQAADTLNWKHEGRFLFSGSQTSTPPVAVSNLADLAAAVTPDDVFQNDAVRTTSRLNESSTVTTGFLASSVASEFFDLLKGIQDVHAVTPFTDELTPAQQTFLNSQLGPLTKAFEGLLGKAAENGLLQQRVDDALQSQSRRADMLTSFIGEIADVDVAEAYTRMTQAQLAVQASAKALQTLQNSTLLNVLGNR